MPLFVFALAGSVPAAQPPSSVLLISVDTLRSDRMSSYGYHRNTSPHIDRLLGEGVRFTEARTVEPLTAPALATMLISLPPHEHGSSRNGLPVRPDLPSLPRVLRRHGFKTAAFVGSWTLRKSLWEMSDHFDDYEAVLTSSRWLGLWSREAKAEDLNKRALAWIADHGKTDPGRPFFLWVHYVEPHTPYVLQEEFLEQIGPPSDGDPKSKSYRYDSEIAYVDDQIAKLLAGVADRVPGERLLTVFVSDHGESLGEHDYWGHGRNLFEPTLRIPMGITWTGHIEPGVTEAPAMIGDLAPTVVGLLGFEVPDFFQGFNWTGALFQKAPAPTDRITYYETHKGAVSPMEEKARVRQQGLLEVARLEGSRKEVYRLKGDTRSVFDLAADPGELDNLVAADSQPSEPLQLWLLAVQKGLALADDLPPPSLSAEDVEALRALGYID
jgi:arylsulfatase